MGFQTKPTYTHACTHPDPLPSQHKHGDLLSRNLLERRFGGQDDCSCLGLSLHSQVTGTLWLVPSLEFSIWQG